jgi:hypothetical protein
MMSGGIVSGARLPGRALALVRQSQSAFLAAAGQQHKTQQ